MEKEIVIDIPDDKKIYGFLREPEEKTDKLVIFVHGFTGNCNEHIFFNGAKYLQLKGVASFRFDLYSWQKKARSMLDCTTQTHVDDLKTVFRHFEKRYSKIYLIGHSWGGIVVLKSKLNAAGIILWDSSHADCDFEDEEYEFNQQLNVYLLHWGPVFIVNKKLYEETIRIIPAADLIKGNNVPMKVICAGNGVLVKGGQEYYDLAKEPKAFTTIEGADHCFNNDGTEAKLFAETLDWIK